MRDRQEYAKLSQQQLLNNLHYQQAQQLAQNLLKSGLISVGQFSKLEKLNLKSFPPLLD